MKKPITKIAMKRKAKAEKYLEVLKLNRMKLIDNIACGIEEPIKAFDLEKLDEVIEAQIKLLSEINALYK